jgi:NIPSNAP
MTMPYELRFYVCRSTEGMAAVSRNLAGPGADMFARNRIDVLAAWHPGLGSWSNVLAYLCRFGSLADGAAAWQSVTADREWSAEKKRLADQLGGPPVESIRSWWMTTADASPDIEALRAHRGLSVFGYWHAEHVPPRETLAGPRPSLLLSPMLGTALHVSVHQLPQASWDDAGDLTARLREAVAGSGYLEVKRDAGWFRSDDGETP